MLLCCYLVLLVCVYDILLCLVVMVFVFVFFFKQKTAYEMRISDWSSDVCSSDLQDRQGNPRAPDLPGRRGPRLPDAGAQGGHPVRRRGAPITPCSAQLKPGRSGSLPTRQR